MVKRMHQQTLCSLKGDRERILQEIARARNSLAALEGELRGLDRAIAIFEGRERNVEPELPLMSGNPHETAERRPRGAVKDIVLSIITERAGVGSKTVDVVSVAKERAVNLDRNSVASLLSRLTREGVLVYDAETGRYRPAPKGPANLRSVA